MAAKREGEENDLALVTKRQRTDERAIVPVGGSALSSNANNQLSVTVEGVKRTSSLDAPIMLLSGHGGAVYTMKFNPQGTAIASGSHDKDIFLWNVQGDCDNYMVLKGHRNAVLDLVWTTDGQHIISASPDKTVRAWDAVTGKQVKKMAEHSSFVNSCCAARRGPPLIISGSDDGTAKLWDMRHRGCIQTFPDKYQVTAVAFSEGADKIFSGGIDNDIKVWDLRKNEVAMKLQGHTETITSMQLSPDGSYLLTNSMDCTLRVWDMRPYAPQNRCVKIFTGHQHNFEKNLLRCNWSPDGQKVTSGSADRMVYIWDTTSRRILYKLPGHSGCVNEAVLHPREPIIGSCGSDKQIYIGEIDPTNQPKARILDKYVLGRELGRGEFGITYLCTDKETQEIFACKSISKKKLRTAVDVEDVRREVAIMKHLPEHPHVVTLKGAYEDDNAVHLVMELCEGGELFDRIIARGHYTERGAAQVTRTIVEVVQACHRQGVMHRDLKPENFLFANKNENSPLKAIDFGLSVFFKPGEKFSEIVGSPYYMAPEVLKRNYGPEVDVWSAGVILYILLCGVPPFWAETEQGVAQAILRGLLDFKRDPWPKVSDSAKSLVRHMLEPDPKARYNAQQVLDHPWLQNAKKNPNVPLDAVRSRLKQFSAMNKLKKRALQVIAERLGGEEIDGLKEILEKLDIDNMGVITFEKLKMGLIEIGSQLTEHEVRLLMEAADVDGNGTLDYGEFVAAAVHLQRLDDDEHLRKAFDVFDVNESGFIEVEELREAVGESLTGSPSESDVVQGILSEVDLDKDGRISYEEFATMMRRGTDWRKASRQYSRDRFNSLSMRLLRDGSLNPPSYSMR